jgi:hypothetical protein
LSRAVAITSISFQNVIGNIVSVSGLSFFINGRIFICELISLIVSAIDNKVFSFLGNELEKKYMDEIDNKKTTKKVSTSKKIEEVTSDIETEEWSKEDDKKLIMLYKKNVPEHALANIFKKKRTEIRARILKLLS